VLPLRRHRRPLAVLVATVATLGLLLAGCSTGPSDSSADGPGTSSDKQADGSAFPVTIKHAFGETTLKTVPKRVATVSWVNADTALALGVVPVGMPKIVFGENQHASTPWADAALDRLHAGWGSDDAPAQYSEADGINYTDIAKTHPDVILATYSGLTKPEYTKLSKIAPVIAYPKLPYGTPWETSTRMIGKALGLEPQAEKLVASTKAKIDAQVAKYPQLQGKSFIYANLDPSAAESVNLYTAIDNRPRFLTSIGMRQAPVVGAHTKKDSFYIPWSAERADELKSDVLVTWVPSDKTKGQITKDPLLRQIPAVKRGSWIADSNDTLTLAISAASALSLPWALDKVLPELGAAADKA
jgi:iron complex transport system substrate-binding protein